MIKKLVYSYVIYYDNYTKDRKRDYKLWSKKSFLYGNDKKPIADTINFYATYHKATKNYSEDFYDYEMCSEDLDQINCFHADNYDIWSDRKLTNAELIEKFEAYTARRVSRVVSELQENYSNIKKALEE